jgi:hypothetical protein
MAEAIGTRIGPLEVQNGYPTEAAAKALYDELDFQRASQAYLWALPAVGFHGLHLAHLHNFGAQDGDVVLYQTLKDKAGMLTPNLTTTYAMSFWNMAEKGPLVVEVPAGATAGGVLDVWQRPVTDTGQTGPDKGIGGKYLILPPGAPDVETEDYIVKHSPTNQLWFATRGLGPDPAEAEATLRKHKLYSWKDRAKPGETKFVPVGGKDWSSEQPRDLRYWEYLAEVLQPEPIEARDSFFVAMLKPLGVEKGTPFHPDDRQKKILTDAAVMGDLMARVTAYDKRLDGATVFPDSHWDYANMVELDQQHDGYGQIDERGSWFYEAIGNSTGMQGKTLGFGQVYLESQKDKDGNWLDGGKSYHLRVPPNAPVKQFWSFTPVRQPDAGSGHLARGRGRYLVAQARSGEERRWVRGPVLRSDQARDRERELRADGPGTGLVHVLPAVRADGALLQQVVGTPGHRSDPVTGRSEQSRSSTSEDVGR